MGSLQHKTLPKISSKLAPISSTPLHSLRSPVQAFFTRCALGRTAPLQLRLPLTSMAAPGSFAVGDGDDMNASLWGELQSFIDLSMIYAKLPLAPFFRLRQVCKEWNRLASDRRFLEQNFKRPISANPYFVVTRPSGGHFLLSSEGSSWSSTPVPRARCEVSGLLFEDSDRNRVFDLHTRVFHTLPPLPVGMQARLLPKNYEDPWTLMTVDTALIPYGFKVIIADNIIGTWIYDSNSGAWTHKLSTHDYGPPAFGTSCVHYNKSLYIRVGDESTGWGFGVQIYDLERDEWDYFELGSAQDVWEYSEIGVWQDRLFVLAKDTTKFPHGVTLEEIPTNSEEVWSVFDCMPGDLRAWMRVSGDYKILNKFCGEHVLFYNRRGVKEERAVLYNLDQKTWDKIDLPATPRKDH